jgi:hypothetical protein
MGWVISTTGNSHISEGFVAQLLVTDLPISGELSLWRESMFGRRSRLNLSRDVVI